VRAGIVRDPSDYSWSSYRCHAFGQVAEIWSPHEEYLKLAADRKKRFVRYRELFKEEIDSVLIEDIRQSANQGLALGSGLFKDQIEALGDRRQRLLRRGPKGGG